MRADDGGGPCMVSDGAEAAAMVKNVYDGLVRPSNQYTHVKHKYYAAQASYIF